MGNPRYLADVREFAAVLLPGVATVRAGVDVAMQAVRQHNVGIRRISRYPVHDGDLLLAQDSSKVAPAERCFRTAIEVARTQYAKLWELRATTTFSKNAHEGGKRNEARAMLGNVYNWFIEGFDTSDLKDANAMLDELNH